MKESTLKEHNMVIIRDALGLTPDKDNLLKDRAPSGREKRNRRVLNILEKRFAWRR